MKINNRNIPVMPVVLVGAPVLIFLIVWIADGFRPLRSKEPPIQVRYDMYYQNKYMAQEPTTFFSDGKVMRDHVPGTIPRDGSIYPYATPEEAEAELGNPLAVSPDVLARGKNRYNTFCATCHSPSGQDTTEVVRRGMQKPPSLAAANAKGYSDARIYHVISAGQNIMPGYADKIPETDRWAIVHYVRELQKAPLKYPETASVPADSTARPSDTTAAGSSRRTAAEVSPAGATNISTATENTEQTP